MVRYGCRTSPPVKYHILSVDFVISITDLRVTVYMSATLR